MSNESLELNNIRHTLEVLISVINKQNDIIERQNEILMEIEENISENAQNVAQLID